MRPMQPKGGTRRLWRGARRPDRDEADHGEGIIVEPISLLPKAELSWFVERVERARREGSFSEPADITPDIARRLLDANDSNRPVKQRLVD